MVCVAAVGFDVVLLAQTTTTEVRRMVGEPLPLWLVVGAGLTLLVLIVVGGLVVRRRTPGAG